MGDLVTKPHHHALQSEEERNAEAARLREVREEAGHRRLGVRGGAINSTNATPTQMFDVVTDDGRCPTCGEPVDDVNAEPLDFDEGPNGEVGDVRTVIFVVLPCGHDFTRRTALGE
jgi:hypothetical protein